MFLIDFAQQRIIPDEELKESMAAERPYQKWMADEAAATRVHSTRT